MGTAETYDKKSYDKKSRPSLFNLWTVELSNFDVNIRFCVKLPPSGRVLRSPSGICAQTLILETLILTNLIVFFHNSKPLRS